MLTNLSIKNKLAYGLGAIVVLILFLLGIAYTNFSRLSEANRLDRHTLEVLLESSHITAAVLQVQASSRGFLLTGKEALVATVNTEFDTARTHLNKTASLTADNPAQQQRLTRLRLDLDNWKTRTVDQQIALRRASKGSAADQAAIDQSVVDGSGLVTGIRNLLDEVSAEENRLLVQRSAEAAQLQSNMSLTLIVGGALCIGLAIAIAVLLLRALLTPINALTSAVGQIAAGDQAARAVVSSNDEMGQVTVEFNRMAQAIQDSQAKELEATNVLRAKVDSLLDVVSRAASGDLTGQVTVEGNDAIGLLGNGLKRMFDNLRGLLNNVQKAGIQV
ncbi:MAG TPA: CHASE3 domain-containing protein, partial [Telluria sp.]|nr:CHASE3 domain-containing protein [Telluria sp.]